MTWTAAGSGLAILLGLVLGAAFFYAGLMKRLDPYQFAEAVLTYDLLPPPWVGLVAAILPWVELTAGFFLTLGYLVEIPGRLLQGMGLASGARLVGGIKRRSCLLLIVLILAAFLVVLLITMARGLQIDCGCGLVGERLVGWGAVGEDALMLAVALFLYWWALPEEQKTPAQAR
ncbi:MAG: MauE/DoxX family redox-associated membrane protein [Desulfobaccales bacterium]